VPSLLPPLFTPYNPVLGVYIGRVDASAAIDQISEASLRIDNVVAPTTVLLIVVVATAYHCQPPPSHAPRRCPPWR
jgi:hypothetical protein